MLCKIDFLHMSWIFIYPTSMPALTQREIIYYSQVPEKTIYQFTKPPQSSGWRRLPKLLVLTQSELRKTLLVMAKLVAFLTFISLVPLLCSSFSPENPTDRRILVLLDNFAIKSPHSLFFKSLQSWGFDLDFKLPNDPKISL